MKDEIKEILDYFRKFATIRENTMISEIEDYITNLQETKTNMEQELQQLYLIKDNLQEENERLHTRIKTIKRRRKAQTAKMKKYREEITNKQNSIVNYKSRNGKAVEYIKEHTNNFAEYLDVYETKELSDILQGSDK